MTRNEFLNEIYRESGFMLPEDRRKAVSYFRECFACGDDEGEVCAKLGEPRTALKKYLSEGKAGRYIRKPLLYAVTMLASPIIIYAAAVALAILLIVTLAVLLLLAIIPSIGVELWLSGIDSFIRLMPSGANFADRLCIIGVGLLVSAIGIFIMLGVYKLYRRLIPWLIGELASSFRRIKRKLRRQVR